MAATAPLSSIQVAPREHLLKSKTLDQAAGWAGEGTKVPGPVGTPYFGRWRQRDSSSEGSRRGLGCARRIGGFYRAGGDAVRWLPLHSLVDLSNRSGEQWLNIAEYLIRFMVGTARIVLSIKMVNSHCLSPWSLHKLRINMVTKRV